MPEQQEDSLQAQQHRVWENGSVWLDTVFVARAPRFRIRKSSIRLSIPDVIWIVLLTIFFSFLFYFIMIPFSWIFPDLIQPLLIGPAVGVFLGWITGRKVSRASPYRSTTGEGIGSYLYVQADSKSYLLKKLFGRTVATSKYESHAGPRKQVVECVEWLGSARASIMPRYDANKKYKRGRPPTLEVEFEEQTEATDWLKQKRMRQEGF